MNRKENIFNKKQIKLNINWKQKHSFTIFSFQKITTIRIQNPQVNLFEKIPKEFKLKLNHHSNAKFKILQNKTNNLENVYLTCNTNKYEVQTSEKISKIENKGIIKDQLINYNYKIFTDSNTDKFFLQNTEIQALKRDSIIEKVLIESGKLNTIEEKLSKGFEFFNKCIKNTNKYENCYQMLLIEYEPHVDIILKLFYYKP